MAGGLNGPPILNGTAYAYPSKTLSALRDELLTMLGFPDPLTAQDAQVKDLAYFRDRMLTMLGFPDPLTNSATKTLAQLRETVIRRVGQRFAAGANPPGLDALIDSFINEAQQTIFRTVEFDKGGTAFPALMTADAHLTEIDYLPIYLLAVGLAKAHYGQPDSQAYFEQMQKYLKDRTAARPPNIMDQIDAWVNEAQQFIFRTVQMDKATVSFPTMMTDPANLCVFDYVPILNHAVGLAKSQYQQKDAKIYFDHVEKYLRDRATRRPAKIVAMCTQWLVMAQRQLYHRYKMLRTEMWWSITLQADKRIYDVPYDVGSALDFRYASEVWIQDAERWLMLRQGINPASFTTTSMTMPTRFEFRQYFEVFPTPDKAYTVWIKGHRGLLAFAADSDVTTIDWEIILLQAVVWGKAHLNHRDAGIFKQDLEMWIGRLNAGTFAGMRFVPRGSCSAPDALPYPQVTFDRG